MSIWQNPADGTLHDDMDGAALALASWPQGMTQLTDEQAAALQNPSAADLWKAYQLQAASLLAKGDTVAIRCIKAGVAYPTDWLAVDMALRAIVSTSSGVPGTLPTYPTTYPAGT